MSALLISMLLATLFTNLAQAADEEKLPLTITGGHETDPRDHGRPVVLIANALGVTPEVFREAFSHVRPAPAGTEPDPDQVQLNKRALLDALARYDVTNALLDRVSDYYRYRPGGGRLWPTKAAKGYAIVKNGMVASITVSDGGAGYSSPPRISIRGHPAVRLKPMLRFGKDVAKNRLSFSDHGGTECRQRILIRTRPLQDPWRRACARLRQRTVFAGYGMGLADSWARPIRQTA